MYIKFDVETVVKVYDKTDDPLYLQIVKVEDRPEEKLLLYI